jgi:hypothetical protein
MNGLTRAQSEIVKQLMEDVERLRVENERLRKHSRLQAEDIMTLGQMVGRCCPLCQKDRQ